jgi:hypothetical protein
MFFFVGLGLGCSVGVIVGLLLFRPIAAPSTNLPANVVKLKDRKRQPKESPL